MRTISCRILILASLTLLSQICHAGGDAPVVAKVERIDVTENGIVIQPTESKHEEKHGRILVSDNELGPERSIVISIHNKTSKKLTTPTVYFSEGELSQQLPVEIIPNQIGNIYVQKKTGLFGVKGVVCYRFDNHSDLVVYFENPYVGPNWYGADMYENISRSAYDNYRAIMKTEANVPVTISRPNYDLYYLGLSGEKTSMQVTLTGKGPYALPPTARRLAIVADTRYVRSLTPKTLISHHGTCLCEYPDGVVKARAKDDACDKWTLHDLGDDKFGLQSPTGIYLRASPDGRVDLIDGVSDSEVWTKISLNGKSLWKSAYGTYLRVLPDGTLGLHPEAKNWETWDE